jgi:hypothetical protein
MKRFVAVFGLVAAGAVAQDVVMPPGTGPKVFFYSSPVMGKAVKGAPYSATEITESSQVLADGTHISHQNQERVYRDGEGRVRRESPDRITIFDPVAGESYTLNPKTMTAVKSAMGTVAAGGGGRMVAAGRVTPVTAGNTYAYTVTTGSGPVTMTRDQAAKSDTEKAAVVAQLDKVTAELKFQTDMAQTKVAIGTSSRAASESLGQKVIEGVTADGTRTTETIEAGSIGNDRPIQVLNERWVSADLKTPVMTKRTDPRTGEETFRLTNVLRGEPGSDLFMLPPGYQIVTAGAIVKKDE